MESWGRSPLGGASKQAGWEAERAWQLSRRLVPSGWAGGSWVGGESLALLACAGPGQEGGPFSGKSPRADPSPRPCPLVLSFPVSSGTSVSLRATL